MSPGSNPGPCGEALHSGSRQPLGSFCRHFSPSTPCAEMRPPVRPAQGGR